MINVIFDLEAEYPIDENGMRATIEKTFYEHGVTGEAEVEVAIVGETTMKQLHKQYMETEEVTDVLSFPLEKDSRYPDGIVRMGNIVVCYPQAQKQAKENNRSIAEETAFLVEHSCLHLLGIHHE